VVAEFGPELSFQALSKMPYLDAVFKEAMRVLPASSGSFRKLIRDVRVGDVTLPTGTSRALRNGIGTIRKSITRTKPP
jgi:cytochrome P450